MTTSPSTPVPPDASSDPEVLDAEGSGSGPAAAAPPPAPFAPPSTLSLPGFTQPAYAAALYLARLSALSRRTQTFALDAAARLISGDPSSGASTFPWAALRAESTLLLRARLELAHYATSTANRILAAVQGVLKEAWLAGLMSAEDYTRAVRVRLFQTSRTVKGRALEREEMDKLFLVCADETSRGRRDAALLAILYGAGLRRAEASGLDLDDLREDPGGRTSLVIRAAKGGRTDTAPVSSWVREKLDGWLDARGDGAGPLLWAFSKHDIPREGSRLTGDGIAAILERLADDAGVARFSPHDLRRTFVTAMFDAGVDAPTVQRLARHRKMDTTVTYDRRGDEAARQAVEILRLGDTPVSGEEEPDP